MEDALYTSTHDLDLENRNVTPGGPEVMLPVAQSL